MQNFRLFVILLCLGVSKLMAAEGDLLPTAEDFADKLGWTFQEAVTSFGNPENVFVHRGASPEEDNVVSYYSDHMYLFWFQDRVWQVRADERWSGEVDGVRMGMDREAIEELWGSPINQVDENPTWTLPDRGFPARIRLYFRDGELIDLYVYRSDW